MTLVQWEMIEKFGESLAKIAIVEAQLADVYGRRVKYAHQYRSALDRRDRDEATKLYFKWFRAGEAIEKLKAEIVAIALAEAEKFKGSEGLSDDSETGDGSGREPGAGDSVSGVSSRVS